MTGLLPYDPLQAWKQLPWPGHKQRRAFEPGEVRAVLTAVQDYDELFAHAFSSPIVFKALLFTGNRPGAVIQAKISDLRNGRIILPPPQGKKRNGMATLPPVFLAELQTYVKARGDVSTDLPLLVSHHGEALSRNNLSKYFNRCMALAFTRRAWPKDNPLTALVDPVEVAHLIFSGRQRGFDGAPPRDPKKLAKRAEKVRAINGLAKLISPEVARMMEGRNMYALRKTHISWARGLVNFDSVHV